MEGLGDHAGTPTRDLDAFSQGLIWGHQSLGWEHYEVHEPEPHILLFKYSASIVCATSHG